MDFLYFGINGLHSYFTSLFNTLLGYYRLAYDRDCVQSWCSSTATSFSHTLVKLFYLI